MATIRETLTNFVFADRPTQQDQPSNPPRPLTDEVPASLVTQYQHRKAQTLAEAKRLAKLTVITDSETVQFIELLHKLAGTAGFFGDGSLGSAAGHFEHELHLASFELRPRIALAGLAGLSNAQHCSNGATLHVEFEENAGDAKRGVRHKSSASDQS